MTVSHGSSHITLEIMLGPGLNTKFPTSPPISMMFQLVNTSTHTTLWNQLEPDMLQELTELILMSNKKTSSRVLVSTTTIPLPSLQKMLLPPMQLSSTEDLPLSKNLS